MVTNVNTPLQESIWLKDDKKKKSNEARDTTSAYLASASCPMLWSWNFSPLVSLLQSGKCPQNEALAWKFHFYTASQTFLLQRKQVQKIDREVVQQRSRQAQVLLIILQCSLLYMQLSLGWVCVLHPKVLITVKCSLKCTYNGQIADDYKSSLRRMWQNLSRVTITWDNGLWWVMTDVGSPQRAIME